jgi:cytoskeletal protein RodZ
MGAYLRSARRRRRVSIERAAEETRIRPDFLMRMESDEFDFLAPAYVRGFLRSYARFLGLNPDPLTEEFDRQFGRAPSDTSQIAAMDSGTAKSRAVQHRRRSKSYVPKERKSFSSWSVAAVLALLVIVALAIVGVVQGDSDDPDENVAQTESSPEPSPSTEPSELPSPSPSPTETLAFEDGIELEVVAATGDCWVSVSTDGSPTAIFSGTIPTGSTETFTADEEMTVILGFPEGVELVVNGTNVGTPGGVDPITLTLPDDIDAI